MQGIITIIIVDLVFFFFKVIWNRLYMTGSGMERGTIYQLRNLINRRNVTKQAKSNVNVNDDFLEVCVTAYLMVAVLDFLRWHN